jgi:VanZ family protein
MLTIMGMIIYLSHQPGDTLRLWPDFFGFDKLLHLIAYGCLAGTFLYGLHPFAHTPNRAVAAIIVVLFCLLFAIGDEFHQSFIPGRFVSGWDVAADTFGAVLVVARWFRHKAGKAAKN